MSISNLRRTRIPNWFEYYREVCPICSKRGGCMVNGEGEVVACIRIESDIQFSKQFPSWIHRLTEKRLAPKNESHIAFIEGNKKIENLKINDIYSALLDHMELVNSHCSHLMSPQRGMSLEEIQVRKYKTFPDKPWTIVNQLQQQMPVDRFIGVPGFYETDYGWSLAGRKGILIPYRSERNEIVGFQTRIDLVPNEVEIDPGTIKGLQARVKEQPNLVQIIVDGEIINETRLKMNETKYVSHEGDYGFVTLKTGQRYYWLSSANKKNGTGAGNPLPVHVALPIKKLENWRVGEIHNAHSVWITEGALKADIAAEHISKVYSPNELSKIGSTFIGVPGVNTWRTVIPILEKMGVKNVNIAYDMDSMSNPKVAKFMKDLAIELKAKGYSANIAMWNEQDGKGIDDLLINRRYPQLKKLF